jgi:hypothetical protein
MEHSHTQIRDNWVITVNKIKKLSDESFEYDDMISLFSNVDMKCRSNDNIFNHEYTDMLITNIREYYTEHNPEYNTGSMELAIWLLLSDHEVDMSWKQCITTNMNMSKGIFDKFKFSETVYMETVQFLELIARNNINYKNLLNIDTQSEFLYIISSIYSMKTDTYETYAQRVRNTYEPMLINFNLMRRDYLLDFMDSISADSTSLLYKDSTKFNQIIHNITTEINKIESIEIDRLMEVT